MPDKPLSHCLLWLAISRAKELGCNRFELGAVPYPGQKLVAFTGVPPQFHTVDMPSPKETRIGDFKTGFGGHTEVRLDVVWSRKPAPAAPDNALLLPDGGPQTGL